MSAESIFDGTEEGWLRRSEHNSADLLMIVYYQ